MTWIRHVIVDLAVTAAILLATVGSQEWAAWVVFIYTPLMLLLKLGALKMPAVKQAKVPDAFYHLMYGANVLLSAYHAWIRNPDWWWVAAGWLGIWGLSAYSASRRS